MIQVTKKDLDRETIRTKYILVISGSASTVSASGEDIPNISELIRCLVKASIGSDDCGHHQVLLLSGYTSVEGLRSVTMTATRLCQLEPDE